MPLIASQSSIAPSGCWWHQVAKALKVCLRLWGIFKNASSCLATLSAVGKYCTSRVLSPSSCTSCVTKLIAAVTEICWPSIARQPASKGSHIPGKRMPSVSSSRGMPLSLSCCWIACISADTSSTRSILPSTWAKYLMLSTLMRNLNWLLSPSKSAWNQPLQSPSIKVRA